MAKVPFTAWPSTCKRAYLSLSPATLQPLFHRYLASHIQTRSLLSHICKNTHTHSHTRPQSLGAFSYLCAVHKKRVNDPVSSLPAAHSLHAAVVVTEREMCLCAVFHKLPLLAQVRHTVIIHKDCKSLVPLLSILELLYFLTIQGLVFDNEYSEGSK